MTPVQALALANALITAAQRAIDEGRPDSPLPDDAISSQLGYAIALLRAAIADSP